MKGVWVVEWVGKDGRIYRTVPATDPTDDWIRDGVRQALKATCKPRLVELIENDDGYLMEP